MVMYVLDTEQGALVQRFSQPNTYTLSLTLSNKTDHLRWGSVKTRRIFPLYDNVCCIQVKQRWVITYYLSLAGGSWLLQARALYSTSWITTLWSLFRDWRKQLIVSHDRPRRHAHSHNGAVLFLRVIRRHLELLNDVLCRPAGNLPWPWSRT